MHDSILNISVCLKFAPIMFNSWMIKKIKEHGENINEETKNKNNWNLFL